MVTFLPETLIFVINGLGKLINSSEILYIKKRKKLAR
jgi:hypothetical protein